MSTKMAIEMKKVDGKKCPEFRASFVTVFEPKSYEGGEPKYSIVMLFPKTTNIDVFRKAAFNAAVEKWGADKAKWPKNLRLPFRDGDDFADRKGYPGHIFISATSKERPGLVNERKERIVDQSDFYSGCYARASVIAFAYDTKGNRGVSFSLQNVQKLRDGERFSGKKDAEDEFDAVETSESTEETVGADSYGF